MSQKSSPVYFTDFRTVADVNQDVKQPHRATICL